MHTISNRVCASVGHPALEARGLTPRSGAQLSDTYGIAVQAIFGGIVHSLLAVLAQGRSRPPGRPCDGAVGSVDYHASDLKAFWHCVPSISSFITCAACQTGATLATKLVAALQFKTRTGNSGSGVQGSALRELVTSCMHVRSGRPWLRQVGCGFVGREGGEA